MVSVKITVPDVACDACGAKPGESCKNPDGTHYRSSMNRPVYHHRRRLAAEAERKAVR